MMNLEEKWENMRDAYIRDSVVEKDSQSVSFRLLDAYDNSSDSERKAINGLLGSWLLSKDESRRYDSAFLIGQRKIQALTSTVQQAIGILRTNKTPMSSFEVEKLNDLLNLLAR